MPLTYQPFAETPAIQELSKDLRMNVSDPERILSTLLGAGLIAAGASRSGLFKWLFLASGAALIRRGWTGHCAAYEQLQIDQRHATSGVPGNRGVKVDASVQVQRSPAVLYGFWRKLEQLPKVMRHLDSVRQLSARRSHWKVKAPLGQSVEWDAEIINDVPDRMIAWQSLPGATVRNAGSVWFESGNDGSTRVKVSLEYDPPAGAVGATIATWLGNSPETDLTNDLAQFKEFAERELPTTVG